MPQDGELGGGDRLFQCRVGQVALRRAGPPSFLDICFWWACARSELVPPYILPSFKKALALELVGWGWIQALRRKPRDDSPTLAIHHQPPKYKI